MFNPQHSPVFSTADILQLHAVLNPRLINLYMRKQTISVSSQFPQKAIYDS